MRMKPTWLIETGVWKDDNVSRMIALLQELGDRVQAEPYPLGGTEFESAGEDGPVIFYGSVNTAQYLRTLHRSWVPLIWFEDAAFSCRSYYAHWGPYLLQERYGFYPLAEVVRLREQLYQSFGREEMVFIRPDENDKSFTGRLVPADNFPQWYAETQASGVDPTALVVVSVPVRIEAEWRFVAADGKVVAGSYYKGGKQISVRG
jgi:ATP-grasp domain, R2K clade family 2